MGYQFTDLVDISKIQYLGELFYQATGILTAIVDLEGNVLTAAGWTEICTKFHRSNPKSRCKCTESDLYGSQEISRKDRYSIYRCKNGLIDGSAPVMVQEEHVANIFTGQVLFEPPDLAYFIKQAEEMGFPEKSYLESLGKVPLVTEAQLESNMRYLQGFAEMLGEMGYHELKQREMQQEIIAASEELALSQKMLIGTLEELRDQYAALQEKENLARDQEALWKFALEGTGQVVWDWDLTRDRVYFSKAYQAFLPEMANEFIGDTKEYISRIHPQDQMMVLKEIEAYLTGEVTIYHTQYRIRDKSDQYRWIVSRGGVMKRDEGGKPLRMAGTLSDVTEQRQLDQLSEERLQQLQVLLDTCGSLMFCLNERLACTLANDAFADFTGMEKGQLSGKTVKELFQPKTRGILEKLVEEARRDKGPKKAFMTDFQTLTGKTASLSICCFPLLGETDNWLGCLYKLEKNIPQQKGVIEDETG